MVKYYFQTADNVGYYVGLLGSAFHLPLFITNTFWGGISDRVGRKPILVVSLIFGIASSFTLGLAETFWLAFAARMLGGIFGANSTVVKGRLGEISEIERRAWGYSMYGGMHAIAMIIGPPLGGYLMDSHHYAASNSRSANSTSEAQIIPKTTRHPFLILCGLGSLFFLISLIATLRYLYEPQKYSAEEQAYENIELDKQTNSEIFVLEDDAEEDSLHASVVNMPESVTKNWKFSLNHPAALPIFLYCMIALANMMYMTALPLYLTSTPEIGGLEFIPSEVSLPISIMAFAGLLVQLSPFYRLLANYGSKTCYIVGLLLMIPVIAMVPLIGIAITTKSNRKVLLVIIAAFLGVSEVVTYQAVIVMITESVDSQHLGVTHGVASTFAAGMRTLAPTLAGIFWEAGVKMQASSFVFSICIGICVVGVLVAVRYCPERQ